jgi:hypothetical protein
MSNPVVEEVVKLIKLGLLKPDMAASPRAIKNAQEEYSSLMKKKHYREMVAKAAEDDFGSIYVPENVQHQIVKPEDFAGHALVNYKTDRSDLGVVDRFLGTQMGTKVQSGTKFTPKHAEELFGWASMGSDTGMSGIANKAHRKAIATENLTDMPSAASSVLMGEESSRFSVPVAEMMLKLVKDNMPSKQAIKAFDAEMRKTDKKWVGLESDEALEQLKGLGDHTMKGAGAHRKRFLQVLEKPEFRKMGFPQPNTALPVIDNPEYAGLPIGTQGLNMWLPDTARQVENMTGLHESYSHIMPRLEGTMGRYEVPVSFAAQNPAVMRALGDAYTVPKWSEKTLRLTKPRPFTYGELMTANMDRSAGATGTIQKIDQESIDSVNKAIEYNKALIAKYGSLPAALAAGEVMADEKPDENYNPFASLVRKYGFTEAQKMINDIKAQVDRKQQIKDDAAKMASWERESHRAPRSDTLIDIGNFIKADEGNIGLLDALGTSLEKIGQGMELSAGDYIFPALEVAALPAMKPSVSSLRSAATKGQPFRHYVDDAVYYDRYGKRMGGKGVSGAELLGSAADYGLNTAFGAATLEEILRKMAEQ